MHVIRQLFVLGCENFKFFWGFSNNNWFKTAWKVCAHEKKKKCVPMDSLTYEYGLLSPLFSVMAVD